MDEDKTNVVNDVFRNKFSKEENKHNREYILLQFRISFNRQLYDENIISFQTFSDMNNYLNELSNKELRK